MNLKSLFSLMLTASLTIIAVTGHAAPSGYTWPMYQANANHDGHIPIKLNPSRFQLRWKKVLSGYISRPNWPAADNDSLYITTSSNIENYSIYALNSLDGSLKWVTEVNDCMLLYDPALCGNKLYLYGVYNNNEEQGILRAYDTTAGKLLFTSALPLPRSLPDQSLAPTPTIFKDSIYGISCTNGSSYAYSFDKNTGVQNWFTLLSPSYSIRTPAVNNDYVVSYSCASGYMQVLNRKNGTISAELQDPHPGFCDSCDPAVVLDDAKKQLIIINAGYLTVYELTPKLKIKWSNGGGYQGQPALANHVIYAVMNNNLVAVDQASGKSLWRWTPSSPRGETLQGLFIVTDSHILIPDSNNIHAISLSTHQEEWSYKVSGSPILSLILSNNSLYVVTDEYGDYGITAFSLGSVK